MNITWKRLEATEVQKIGYRTIVTKHFELPDGTVHDYAIKESENSHCVATVALTPDNKVIIARQYRPGPEKILDELPGGGVNPNEDLTIAAARELIEETGYQPAEIKHIGDAYKDAYTNTLWHFFLATDCTLHPDGAQPDDHEFIDIRLISIEELLHNARSTKMTDVEGVFLAYDHLLKFIR